MKSLFVSYSHADGERVRRLAERLLSAGYEVRLDAEFRIGSRWRENIVSAMKECAGLILALSSSSINSKEVKRELDIAGDLDMTVLPVFLEALPSIPDQMRYLLAGIHWIDLSEEFEEGIAELLLDLKEMYQVGPEEFIWGVRAKDVELVRTEWSKGADASEQLTRLLLRIAELSDAALRRLGVRLVASSEEDKRLSQALQDTAQVSAKLKREELQIGELGATEASLRIIQAEQAKLLRKELKLLKERARVREETETIFIEMQRQRESQKPVQDFISGMLKKEGQVARDILRKYH